MVAACGGTTNGGLITRVERSDDLVSAGWHPGKRIRSIRPSRGNAHSDGVDGISVLVINNRQTRNHRADAVLKF